MRRIEFIGKDVKSKRASIKRKMKEYSSFMDFDIKLELIKSLLPLGLLHVNEILQEEVEQLAGKRYKRDDNSDYDRWGSQGGSIYLGGQKIPINYPRVRDTKNKREVRLRSYEELQQAREVDELLLRRILNGISCRRYTECVQKIPEAFGMSASSVSRKFIEASGEKLKEFFERRLDGYDIVCILIDGKFFYEDEMIIAVGITSKGEKVILGFIQSGTENSTVCSDFLEQLIERGLNINNGILCIIDGSKGLRKSIEKVFGKYALVQRCQWHKRENVVDYLPKSRQEIFRRKLQEAYEEPTYQMAKSRLLSIGKELKIINESAYRSLKEGFEETLTLHKLGMFEILGTSLKTTNCIESIMSQIGQRTDKVDYWRNSNQKHRWLATVLLDIEKRLKKIKGYKHISLLRFSIKRKLGLMNNKRVA
jgi:putative transposase